MPSAPLLKKRRTLTEALFSLFIASLILGSVPVLSSIRKAQAVVCTPVSTSQLLGHWKFDEGTGTTTADSTGNGHTGTLENGPTWSTGTTLISPNPAALSFDGSNDRVRVADSSDLRFGTGSFSVTAFARTNAGNRSALGNFNPSNQGWGLFLTGSGVNFFAAGDAGSNDPTFSASVFDNNWHHLAGTFSRSGSSLTIRTYVDGGLIGTSTANVGDISSPSDLLFGRFLPEAHYLGRLDDIRVYGRALSASEVDSLADGCNGISSSSGSSASTSTGSSVSSNLSSISSSVSSALSSLFSSSLSSSLSSSASPLSAPSSISSFSSQSSPSSVSSASTSRSSPLSSLSGGSSVSSLIASASSASGGVPTCNGQTATIYVVNGVIVGGPDNGDPYRRRLRGTNGNDVIVGTNGKDRIRGRDGDDVICGRGDDDRIWGNDGDDVLKGGAGNDDLNGGDGDDDLYASSGNDDLRGGDEDDLLCGWTGNDEIRGGDDNDRLDGGAGNDELDGGDETDICRNGEDLDDCENTVTNIAECASDTE